VLEHQPAAQRKFEEVKGEIAQLLRAREASEMAYKDGLARLEALKKGEDPGVRWGPARNVSRREAQGLPADVLRRVVSADASKLPAYVGVPIPDSGYLLVRISRVTPGAAASEQERAQALARAAQAAGAAQFDAYVASLKARASVDVKTARLEKK
jgi:peptidyl-prolyl cis-trans isomerase D